MSSFSWDHKRLLSTINQGRSVIQSYYQATWAFWRDLEAMVLWSGGWGNYALSETRWLIELRKNLLIFTYQTTALSTSTSVSQSSLTEELYCIYMHRSMLQLFL